jgi:hypothetical protein
MPSAAAVRRSAIPDGFGRLEVVHGDDPASGARVMSLTLHGVVDSISM